MKPLTKIAIGAAAVLGTMALYSKGVGDEARVNDFVLVPLKDLQGDTFAAAKASPELAGGSAMFRVTGASGDVLTVMARGVISRTGATLEQANGLANEKGPFEIHRSNVVGILKREVEVTQNPQLEKGAFA